MGELIPLKTKIDDLDAMSRKVMRALIRIKIKRGWARHFSEKLGYPQELTEEVIESLLNKGFLKIYMNDDKEYFEFKIFDPVTQEYEKC